ncbi:TetR family transcriptional regulator OS=Ureibacillus acetophenoni OX=614649 GN=SAMN05877842_10523 PE=4 SV=1 [Ureibacillus acetophenoni]
MAREKKFTNEELYHAVKHLLLKHGYDGFTFTVLASYLDVSRAAIYKYYENKEELLSEYMVYELEKFLNDMKVIGEKKTFQEQFDALFDMIFSDLSLYEIRTMGMQIPIINNKIKANKQKISGIIIDLFASLQQFVELGKKESVFKEELPNNLILGMIFETVNIRNQNNIPLPEWVEMIKDVISHGLFKNN